MKKYRTPPGKLARFHMQWVENIIESPTGDWVKFADIGWQPIETAPKDGSRVLVWSPDGKNEQFDRPLFVRWETRGGETGWHDDDCPDSGPWEYSHWLPIPEPPK